MDFCPKMTTLESTIPEKSRLNLEFFQILMSFWVDFVVPLSNRLQDFVTKTLKQLYSEVCNMINRLFLRNGSDLWKEGKRPPPSFQCVLSTRFKKASLGAF